MPAERQSPKPSRTRRARRTPHPLYAGVVIGLVVFVAGLLVLPPALLWHEAETTIACSDAEQCAAAADAIRQRLSDADAARELLKELGPPAGADEHLRQDWPPYSEIERLRTMVRVTPAEADDVPQVTLTAIDSDQNRALQIVERLAAGAAMQAETPNPVGTAIDPAVQSQLDALKAAERQARARLDAFVKEHLQPAPGEPSGQNEPAGGSPPKTSRFDRGSVEVGARENSPAAMQALAASSLCTPASVLASPFQLLSGTQGPPPGSAAAGGQFENPEWIKLMQDLDARTSERNRLLRQMTPLHPQVQAIDAEIGQIRARLEVTPRYEVRGANSGSNPAPAPPGASSPYPAPPGTPPPDTPPTPAPPPETSSTPGAQPSDVKPPDVKPPDADASLLATHASQYNALRKDYEAARRALVEAEALMQELAAQPSVVSKVGLTHTVEPPHVVRSHGGEPARSGVIVLSVLSLVAGVAAAWACRGAAPVTNTFASAEEAGKELGMPVLGEIQRSTKGASKPRVRLRQTIAVRAVRVAEMLLVVFIAGFLIVSIIDSPLVVQALKSPLGAASRIMQRLTEII